eukprot:symbB.v1.2.035003.t1/scaffold4623.1/size37307/6
MNLIDTPGHVDFTIEVERALRVLDGAVLICCGVGGVQSQTITVDRQMKRYEVPRVIFINKLDRYGSDPFLVLGQIRKKLGLTVQPVQLPIGEEDNFKGICDLVSQRASFFEGKDGISTSPRRESRNTFPCDAMVAAGRRFADIPEDMKEKVAQNRANLLETLADVDDEFAEVYLESDEVPEDAIHRLAMKDLRNVAEPGYYSEEELLREAGLVFEEAPGRRLLAKTEPSRRFGCQRQHVIVTVGLLFLSIGSIAVLWSFHPLGGVSFDNRTAGRSERVNQVPSKLEPDVPQISRPYLALREMRARAPSFLANIARIAKATNATNVTNGTNVSNVTPLPAWNSSSTVKTMPSLFCFTLMIPGTAEQGLLETAAQLKTSLFACDDHAIFSNVPGKVWGTQISVLWNVNLWCDKQPTPKWAGGAGSRGPWSAANTRVFQIVWAAVLADVRWKKHDWIVKTDADTVFLPSSLRGALIHNSFVRGWYNPAGSYLGNCAMGLYGGAFQKSGICSK